MIAADEDLKDIAENLELLDVREKWERRVRLVNAELKVPLDRKEKRDHLVRWVKKEMTDHRACPVLKDHQDLKEPKDKLDPREILDLPDLLDLLVHQESCLFCLQNYSSNETVQRHLPDAGNVTQSTEKKSSTIAISAQLVASRTTDRKRI